MPGSTPWDEVAPLIVPSSATAQRRWQVGFGVSNIRRDERGLLEPVAAGPDEVAEDGARTLDQPEMEGRMRPRHKKEAPHPYGMRGFMWCVIMDSNHGPRD